MQLRNWLMCFLALPEQLKLLLSSEYPYKQVQKNEPSMLVQLCSHPPLLTEHSLISKERYEA